MIRSADWNAAIKEIERLGNTTSSLNKNDFKGTLTIEGALTISRENADATLDIKGSLSITDKLNLGESSKIVLQKHNIEKDKLDKFEKEKAIIIDEDNKNISIDLLQLLITINRRL